VSDLAERIRVLEDVEALKRLKYRYWRHLDCKDWQALEDCFVPEATASYGSGRYRFESRDAILGFLRESLGVETGSVTIHHGHHPEIEVTGESTARGRWALYNYLFNEKQRRSVRIGAIYEDEYVKLGGEWKIRHVGYETLFHEEWSRNDLPSLRRVDR
jgi:bile-acid 7alpha-dehydratase